MRPRVHELSLDPFDVYRVPGEVANIVRESDDLGLRLKGGRDGRAPWGRCAPLQEQGRPWSFGEGRNAQPRSLNFSNLDGELALHLSSILRLQSRLSVCRSMASHELKTVTSGGFGCKLTSYTRGPVCY